MRVLLTGATGLIGSAILARLVAEGNEVTAVVRRLDRAARRLAAHRIVARDIRRAKSPADWLPLLAGIDAVVNAAGVLQEGAGDSPHGVHAEGIPALFAACEQARIRRVIHISALGVDREAPTGFSRTKLIGDGALMARDLDWVILRPSVVVGRAAYGGSALIRALAALPFVPVIADAGRLQIVQLDDVTTSVSHFLTRDAPARLVLDLAGPQALTLSEVIRAYRRWFGSHEGRTVPVPSWLLWTAYRLGDLVGRLGWRSPIRTTAGRELLRGSVGDPAHWQAVTGIRAKSLAEALAGEPASVQERWFARLYLLKPVVFALLAGFWVATGLIALGPGLGAATSAIGSTGGAAVVAGSLADIAVGVAIAFRSTARFGLYAALVLSVLYLLAGTVLTPLLWLDPFGPLLKILPGIGLGLVALAIVDDR